MTFKLRAPWCLSLKDKRSVVKAIMAGLKKQFNVSVCESGSQDATQMIEISTAALAFDHAQGDSIAENLINLVYRTANAELYDVFKEYR